MCLVIGWFAFVQGARVPILSGVDLAFHEASHFLTSFLPRVVYFAGGSIGQIAWPLGIGIAFIVFNKDALGAGLCFAWAGSSAQNVSLYIADAPTMALPLIGGQHDWNTILGYEHFDRLDWADGLSKGVWTFGLLLWIGGLALCIAGPWIVSRREDRLAREADAALGGPAPSSDGWAVVAPWDGPSDEGPTSPPGPTVAPSD